MGAEPYVRGLRQVPKGFGGSDERSERANKKLWTGDDDQGVQTMRPQDFTHKLCP